MDESMPAAERNAMELGPNLIIIIDIQRSTSSRDGYLMISRCLKKPSLKTHVQDAHAVELPVWDQCIQVMCFFSESNDLFQSFKKAEVVLVY